MSESDATGEDPATSQISLIDEASELLLKTRQHYGRKLHEAVKKELERVARKAMPPALANRK